MANQLYTEDVKAIKILAEQTNMEVASNVFRLNENQYNALKNNKLRASISINAPSVGRRGPETKVTPRMTEAAATLSYMGFKQSEIANIYNCDVRTVSHKLVNYHGWTKYGF